MKVKQERAETDWPNLPSMMFALARRWPERVLFRHHRAGTWHDITWAEFARQAEQAATGFLAAGVRAGDRVLIVSENRPEVPVAETALMAIEAVPVPGYTTSTATDLAHLLRDSGARAALVSTPAVAAQVREAAAQANGLDLLVTMEGADGMTFAALLSDPTTPGAVAERATLIPASTLCALLYTSGTSGPPKGVCLPHRAVLSNVRGVLELAQRAGFLDGVYLSFLPLSHSYEHTVGQFILPALGNTTVYARGLEHLAADMVSARPTLITVVPRMLEILRTRVLAGAARETGLRRQAFDRALAAGLRRQDGCATMLDRVLDPVLDRLVRRKVQARFGGRLRAAISGGARLEPETARFFIALGIPVVQGYGQTEAGPVISVNLPWANRPTTVGPPSPGVEARIAPDGEILVRGDLVMDGYWNQPDATAAAIRDGWLHTGDVGEIVDGRLQVTDRKKDILVLSGGEKVWPARLESLLSAEPEIVQAVVAGDGQNALSALLVAADGADEAGVAAAVGRVNKALSPVERIRRHAMVPAFTIENGLLTPSQKVRRAAVMARFADALEARKSP